MTTTVVTTLGPRCETCAAPAEPNRPLRTYIGAGAFGGEIRLRNHADCADAWRRQDADRLAALRAAACNAGHHRFPGRWTRDPADPTMDASFWKCASGCGHIQRHPGYGIGAAIRAMFAGQPPYDPAIDGTHPTRGEITTIECDECGAQIPAAEPSLVNDKHQSFCSLYPSAAALAAAGTQGGHRLTRPS